MSREPASSQLAGTAGQVMQSAVGRPLCAQNLGEKYPLIRRPGPREKQGPATAICEGDWRKHDRPGNPTSGPGSGQRPAAQLLVESPRSLFATCVLAGQGVRCRREPLSYAELEVLG